jgi:hypothetical protein
LLVTLFAKQQQQPQAARQATPQATTFIMPPEIPTMIIFSSPATAVAAVEG